MSEVTVSVVIPTLNSEDTLEKCLASVKSNITRHKYEVIVVDAGSTDGTAEIAKKYADKYLKGTPSRINRNKGIENARGGIICFTDSDCIVPENWIDSLVEGLIRLHQRDERIVGVGSGNIPVLEDGSLMEVAIAKAMRSPFVSFKARNTAVYKDECEVLHNPPLNSAYFKWVLDRIDGFREEPGYPEDLDLDARIVASGYKLYYLPDVLVYHKHKTDPQKFARQMQDFGRKRLRVNREHRNISRLYHWGPVFLCMMLYSPLFFIPLSMALLNAVYVSLVEEGFRLFFPVVRLTLGFYQNYGLGEMKAVMEGQR